MDAETWAKLVTCKHWGTHDGTTILRLYAPVDEIHEAMVALANSAKQSLHVAMYGYDDKELDALFRKAWENHDVLVKIALDATQAGGIAERPLLSQWPRDVYTSSIIVGQSSKHKISHMKLIIADDCCLSGSTNLSDDGENKQNNECTIIWSAKLAQEAQTRVSQIFAEMASQPHALSHIDLFGPANTPPTTT